MSKKKALVAVGHEPIPFSVSHPRRHLPSTPLDLVRAKAVDRSLQQSSTDQIRITATASCRLAMPEIYEHPTILWRRVVHRPLHETGSFLQSQMLPKVSVLYPFGPLSSRATYPYPNQRGLVQPCVDEYGPILYLPACTLVHPYMPQCPPVLLSTGDDGPGCYHFLPRGLEFHFITFDRKASVG